MAQSDHQTNHTATRTNPATRREDGVPLATWIIGTAAFLVVLMAGALFLDGSDDEPGTQASESPDEEAAPEEKTAPVVEVKKKNPLDITASFLDAQERSKLWNPKASLSGIELVVLDGEPSGKLKFEFGETVGPVMPGAPLSAKRHTVSYEGKRATATSMDSPQRRVALPEPNCPLDVAFRTLSQSGISTSGRVGVLYLQSEKHGRPVWLMTNEAGQANHINADNCALLRR